MTMTRFNKTTFAHAVAATVAVTAAVVGATTALVGAAAPGPVPAAANFTAVASNVATGTLLGAPVTLSGTHVWGTPTSTLDESWPYFAYPSTFSPALAKTDAIQIAGGPDRPYSYTLDFGGATVTNPVLHLASLGSKIQFPASTPVTKVTGDASFVVSGSSVTGTASNTITASGNSDSSGSLRLGGTFNRITFSAKTNYAAAVEDGVLVQVVVPMQFADFTAVASNVATGTLLGAPLTLSGTHVWGTPTSTLDGSWSYFANVPTFAPALAKTDAIQIAGGPDRPYPYTLDFGGATVTNPILHLASLGSKIDFPAGTAVSKASGDSTFIVSGSSVTGTASNTITASGNSDSSGSVQLIGTYSKITFTAKTNYVAAVEDGILIQIGGVVLS